MEEVKVVNQKECSYEYQIETAPGTAEVSPHVHQVHEGDVVCWNIRDGHARITFLDAAAVAFSNDLATPGNPARGVAQVGGTHQFSVTVWKGESAPRFEVAVLIIEP